MQYGILCTDVTDGKSWACTARHCSWSAEEKMEFSTKTFCSHETLFTGRRVCLSGSPSAWVDCSPTHFFPLSRQIKLPPTWWIRRLLFINLSDTIESSAYNNPYRIAFSVTEARVPSGHLKSLEKFVHSEVMVYNICILCDASSFLYPPKFIVLQTIRLNVVRLWWWIVFN